MTLLSRFRLPSPFTSLRGLVATGALLSLTALAGAQTSSTMSAKKILFFSKSSGFEHSVIKQAEGQPSFAQKILTELGAKNGITFTFSKDGSLFTPDYLNQFDGYIFYTTGDLTTAGTDKNPPMSPEGKQALLDAVKNGKGFMGIHSATDTFHSKGEATGSERYTNDGDGADPYIKMIGGEFIKHGSQQKVAMIQADPHFAGVKTMPASEPTQEEWYSMKDFAPDLHVILAQNTKGMVDAPYERPNYPATWTHLWGKGRVFYTSMGHREDVWTSDDYQALLMAGINWTTGRVDADVTANIKQVTPEADQLPPNRPSGKKKDAPAKK